MIKQITIIWYGKEGGEISRTNTGDEDTPENRKDLCDYIEGDGKHVACTEGLDAPTGWKQFDLVSITLDCEVEKNGKIDGEVVDLQESNNINTTSAAPAAIPVAAPVASESVPQSSKFCSECGAKISAKAEVCPRCGVRSATTVVSGHDKTTAALLALFLGGIGAHKFYLGRTGMGLIYLVFCWTMVPALIGLIEGIQFLSMSESEFAIKYR